MTDKQTLLALARTMTPEQRSCGDVLDNLPCDHCGARSLRSRVLSMVERMQAANLINNNPGLMNFLRARAGAGG